MPFQGRLDDDPGWDAYWEDWGKKEKIHKKQKNVNLKGNNIKKIKEKLFIIFQDDHHYCQVMEIEDNQKLLKKELREIDVDKDGVVLGVIKGHGADLRKFVDNEIDFGSNSPEEYDKIYVAYWNEEDLYHIKEFELNDINDVKKLLENENRSILDIPEELDEGVIHGIIRGRKAKLIKQDRYKVEWEDTSD